MGRNRWLDSAFGEKVRIAKRYPALHHRVPNYVKGMVGEIERVCQAFGQPEKLALGASGEPRQTLYRVRLSQPSIWEDYDGNTPGHAGNRDFRALARGVGVTMSHDHDHPPPRPDDPEPKSHYELLGVALNELLLEKGIFTADEQRYTSSKPSRTLPRHRGPRWSPAPGWTPDFKKTLTRRCPRGFRRAWI